MTDEELQLYNAMLRKWGSVITRKLTYAAKRFSKGKKGSVTRGIKRNQSRTELKLDRSMSHREDMHYGAIDYIGFNFERHGVFVHKGVGRGYTMSGGMVIRGMKPGKQQLLHAKDQNRAIGPIKIDGAMKRRAVEWFNPILDATVPALADKVAEMNADAAVNATKMYIK